MTFRELVEILVCPACRHRVTLERQTWLVCANPECRRKYPVREGIPIMLVEEGDKYVDVPVEQLEPLGPEPE
ncbi:Trm112 family protein [Carboxydochorda subterranea]|uniref:Trm112 family protein n=1 Tax=Carboxydichorda subterranea TaxID=3109565 RepID=A0ABZ1BYA1_9FIRM|nr:Trm112 family protein [Limnochorda sp. L945t]WRP17784.1 Trm112 family protein [Limnochorda sp. L945t]